MLGTQNMIGLLIAMNQVHCCVSVGNWLPVGLDAVVLVLKRVLLPGLHFLFISEHTTPAFTLLPLLPWLSLLFCSPCLPPFNSLTCWFPPHPPIPAIPPPRGPQNVVHCLSLHLPFSTHLSTGDIKEIRAEQSAGAGCSQECHTGALVKAGCRGALCDSDHGDADGWGRHTALAGSERGGKRPGRRHLLAHHP